MRKSLSTIFVIGLLFLQSAVAFGGSDSIPPCPDLDFRALPIINAQVLAWKQTEPNQFRKRARVRGRITQVLADKNGHRHFEIQIGPNENADVIEVIYNSEFGALPPLAKGLDVEACGDFIVSTAQSGPYPPSPAGAIIHWVHMNPAHRGHPPGYLWIEGTFCGQDISRASQTNDLSFVSAFSFDRN